MKSKGFVFYGLAIVAEVVLLFCLGEYQALQTIKYFLYKILIKTRCDHEQLQSQLPGCWGKILNSSPTWTTNKTLFQNNNNNLQEIWDHYVEDYYLKCSKMGKSTYCLWSVQKLKLFLNIFSTLSLSWWTSSWSVNFCYLRPQQFRYHIIELHKAGSAYW